MNTRKIFCYGLIAVILVLAFAACKHEPDEPAHVHDWKWTESRAATCTEAGEEAGVCKLDATHTTTRAVAINPNAHEWGEWDATTPATCEDDGEGTRECNRCGIEDPDTVIPAIGHDWNTTYTTIDAATETGDGTEAATCKNAPNDPTHTKTRIQYATGSTGLLYTAIDNDTAYRVRATDGTNPAGNVVIPAYHRPDADSPYLPVTEIGNGTNSQYDNAFGGAYDNANTSVTGITFTEGSQLTTISNFAFNYCTNLASITIPEDVTTIGNGAFGGCTSLTSITIPEGVTSIGNNAFQNCTSLTSVTIPEGVTTIGNGAFGGCTSLTSITIPDSVMTIGIQAFYDCTNLANITIPTSVTTIDESAFMNCTNLANITIPNSVTTIGNYAFYGCTSLANITIPASVTSIGNSAFYGCTSLASIAVDANNPNYASESGILYNKAKTELIAYPSATGTITIPASVTTIGDYAFSRCTGLTSVTIPEDVTTIGRGAFQNCTNLTSVTIPNSVTTIDSSTFNFCENLASITIPNSVTTIGSGAFQRCTSLASITIPASVTSISQGVFGGWTAEQTINVPFVDADATPAGWEALWNYNCNAVIKYWNGTTWE